MTFNDIQTPEGSGADPSVATDRVAGKDYQQIKLVKGTENSTTPIDEDSPLDTQAHLYYDIFEVGSGFAPLPAAGNDPANLALKTAMHGVDDSSGSVVPISVKTSSPTGGEIGIVTRNIPSGTQPVSGTVYIKDSAGNNIDSVPDQTMGTGKIGILPMAYDSFNAQYAPIPLGSNGDSVSCTLQYANTSLSITPASNTTLGTITTSTGTVTTGSLDGYGSVSVIVWGTFAGVNFTSELSSDGLTWDVATMTRTDSAAKNQATGVITSNETRSWTVTTGGIRFFRIRATAWTSGTMNVRITATLSTYVDTVTIIPSGTQTVSGTVTANPILTTGAGATTNYKNLDLKATTGVSIKASKTFIAEMYAYNNTGATLYVKLYSKATAPTSADTPQLVYGVKAGEGVALLGGQGMELAAGFGARCTTGVADADNTDPAANGCVFSACYI